MLRICIAPGEQRGKQKYHARFGISHPEIGARLRPLPSLRGLKLPHKRVVLRALELYSQYPQLDFEDALSMAHMERLGLREILSYDRDFERVLNVIRQEP